QRLRDAGLARRPRLPRSRRAVDRGGQRGAPSWGQGGSRSADRPFRATVSRGARPAVRSASGRGRRSGAGAVAAANAAGPAGACRRNGRRLCSAGARAAPLAGVVLFRSGFSVAAPLVNVAIDLPEELRIVV